MSINIGDTPKQLKQGLMFDGEVWTEDRIKALQAQVEQLREFLTEASMIAGFLSYHLHSRMSVNALADLAKKADAWGKAAKEQS
jgi:hypothetical protein